MRIVIAAALAVAQLASLTEAAWSQSDRDSDFIDAARSLQRSIAPVMCVRAMQPQLQPLTQPLVQSQSPSGRQSGAPSGFTSLQTKTIIAGTAFFLTPQGGFLTAASVLANFLAPNALAGCTMVVGFTSPRDSAGNFTTQSFPVVLADCVVEADIEVARCRTRDDLATINGGRFAPVPVVLEDRQPDTGSQIGASGFVLYETMPIAMRAHIGGYQPPSPGVTMMFIDRSTAPGRPEAQSMTDVEGSSVCWRGSPMW